MNDNPIEYEIDNQGFVVKYTCPNRPYSNLREELNNDVKIIYDKYGPVYIAFSSGVDSQVILRCWLDMGFDMAPFFMYVKGCNDYELEAVRKSENFFGIKIRILEIDLNQHKEKWIRRSIEENAVSLIHYPFEWASKQLPEKFPIIMSGANEPAIIGSNTSGISIYHNYYESLLMRFNMINRSRIILDFPYSAESLAAYYCDDIVKTYSDVSSYFYENDLVHKKNSTVLEPASRFNFYVKPFVKGKYFKKDILWPTKKTGYENYPDWMIPHFIYPQHARVSALYNQVTSHLESCNGSVKEFREWLY